MTLAVGSLQDHADLMGRGFLLDGSVRGPHADPRVQRDTRQLALFFLLACAISWATWGIPVVPILGPMLAAIVVTAVTTGRAGLHDLAARLARWRVPLRWWLVAVSPVPLALLALAGLWIIGQDLPAVNDVSRAMAGPVGLGMVSFLLITLVASVGEEVGWRGYALPRLQRRLRPLPATLILAVFWWLWHLEFFLIDQIPLEDFPIYIIEVTAVAIILTWIYNGSGGSVLLVAVWHAAYNWVSFTASISVIIAPLATLQALLLVVLELRAQRHSRSILGPTTLDTMARTRDESTRS
jgi:uncharacterized protein